MTPSLILQNFQREREDAGVLDVRVVTAHLPSDQAVVGCDATPHANATPLCLSNSVPQQLCVIW